MNILNYMFDDYIEYDKFKIKIPKVRDIKNIGSEKFNSFVTPYMVTKDMLVLEDDNIKSKLKDFDLFFLYDNNNKPLLKDENGNYFIDLLVESLKLYISKDIKILNSQSAIMVNKTGIIYRDNFDDIANIILKINHAKKFKVEKVPKFKNARQREVYNKIMEGRKRKQQKEMVNIETIINIVIHGGRNYIPYREIEEMTIFQLLNSYASIIGIENFEYNYRQFLAGADPKKLDMTHWIEKLKL